MNLDKQLAYRTTEQLLHAKKDVHLRALDVDLHDRRTNAEAAREIITAFYLDANVAGSAGGVVH